MSIRKYCVDDYAGNKYNHLTIICESKKKKSHATTVDCLCEICGSVTSFVLRDVLRGSSRMCRQCYLKSRVVTAKCSICSGMFEKRNMKDSARFGLVCSECYSASVVKKCHDCDELVDISNGNHSGYCAEHWNHHRVAYSIVQSSAYRSRQLGIDHDIDIEWVKERLVKCEVTGIPFEIREIGIKGDKSNYSNRNPYTPSIDKINPDLGYTKDNCRLVCWWYNLAKSIWSDDFVEQTIAQWIKNKEDKWQILLSTNHAQTAEVVTT